MAVTDQGSFVSGLFGFVAKQKQQQIHQTQRRRAPEILEEKLFSSLVDLSCASFASNACCLSSCILSVPKAATVQAIALDIHQQVLLSLKSAEKLTSGLRIGQCKVVLHVSWRPRYREIQEHQLCVACAVRTV